MGVRGGSGLVVGPEVLFEVLTVLERHEPALRNELDLGLCALEKVQV